MNDEKKILKTPSGMKPVTPNMNAQEAYVVAIGNLGIAITTLVERMEGIETKLDEIGGELAVLSRYAQRKGEQDNLWTPDDTEFLTGEEDGGTKAD